MKKVSSIGSLVKKIYRTYSAELLTSLQVRGFTDLRPSFLEVLLFICEHEGPSIKEIGVGCGLKKQTMTSHLNELERRGYVERKINSCDKRGQNIFLTEYGLKFKLNLFECIGDIEKKYTDLIGDLELNRIELILKSFHSRLMTQPALFECISDH